MSSIHLPIAFALLALTTGAAPAQSHSITDLGTLGGATSAGRGVRSSTQIVGESRIASGAFHAFATQSGALRDLVIRIAQREDARVLVDAAVT